MEATRNRQIRSGARYDHLFPGANVDTHTILKNAGVGDTVSFIPKVVSKTLDQTKAIARMLKGDTDYDTCRNIWLFVYQHIAYRRDKTGYEQIRSPARSWHDRKSGVDCDCYTTFISSILTNLKIPHLLRITKYSKPYFQHIYPVVVRNGKEIILDCVTDKFDYEVPYSEKKDHPMDLQYLDGLGDTGYVDNRLFDGSPEMDQLGKLFGKKKKPSQPAGQPQKKSANIFKKIGAAVKKVTKSVGTAAKKVSKSVGTAAKKVGKAVAKTAKKIDLKKVVNAINKVNPVTLALRNGLLAGMKLNVGNVAKRLRWSYVTPDQARAKGMQMDRWNKLVEVRKKLENIFYGAGGKPENLKNAILNGKGNSDKAVHGFDGFGSLDYVHNMSIHTPLSQLLGPEVYYSENSAQTLGELGEPVTLAVVAAASGAIATIAKLIKKIGDIFGGKGQGAKDFDEAENAEAEKEIPAVDKQAEDAGVKPDEILMPLGPSVGPTAHSETTSSPAYASAASTGAESSDESGTQSTAVWTSSSSPSASSKEVVKSGSDEAMKEVSDSSNSGGETFWEKHKKWLLPVGIGVGGLALVAVAIAATKSGKPASSSKPMHGAPSSKNHQRKKAKRKKEPEKHQRKVAVKFI